MKYYLHDTSAFDDEKISELFLRFGYEGLGLFYTALEKIGKQEKPIKTEVLKAQLRIGKRLEKCWSFMEQIGLISSSNGESFNNQLLNFSESYQIKKEKTREKVSEWRKKQVDTKSVTSYVPVSNPPKVKESKVKESNKENIKEFDFVLPEFKDVFNSWLKYKKDRRESYKSEQTIKSAYKKLIELSGANPQIAALIIDQSFAGNYAGLFELKIKPLPPKIIKPSDELTQEQKEYYSRFKIIDHTTK